MTFFIPLWDELLEVTVDTIKRGRNVDEIRSTKGSGIGRSDARIRAQKDGVR